MADIIDRPGERPRDRERPRDDGGTGTTIAAAPAGCIGGYKPKQVGGIPVEPCRSGFSPRSAGNVTWCCQNTGTTAENKVVPGAAGAASAEPSTFSWSPGQQSAISQLIERAGALLRNPTGMTPEQREQMTSYVTRGIKAPMAGELRAVEEGYARGGLIGSPAQVAEQEKVRRSVREQVANARAMLAIDEQKQRYEREVGGLGAAGGALTQSASMERALEEANAARRGEGRESINQLLALFSQLFGASAGNYSNIMQAIMGRMGTQTNQAGMGDWLPYLAYMGGQKLEGKG